jgi:recombinational DNA repair protein RecR
MQQDMVNKTTLIDTLEKKIKKIAVGTCLDVRSYKRDRKILVVKSAEDVLRIIEDGFDSGEYVVLLAEFRKLMKTLIRREFPRSTKIRIYMEENWSGKDTARRKTI